MIKTAQPQWIWKELHAWLIKQMGFSNQPMREIESRTYKFGTAWERKFHGKGKFLIFLSSNTASIFTK